MTRPLLGLLLLARPGNAFMAAGGALAGAVAAPGEPFVASLGLVMAACVFGVAGGNALNDARDAEIDKHAHPDRPIPRGFLTPAMANAAAVWLFVVALTLLTMTNPAAASAGLLFVAGLVTYEWRWKARGLSGNILVSVLVGGTFLLGAWAAQRPALDIASFPLEPGWLPCLFAGLAALVNVSRELFKDLQDREFDRAWRTTMPLTLGAAAATAWARALLVAAIVLAVVPVWLRWVDWHYGALVAPALSLFAVALFVKEPGRASFVVKMGMLLALIGFVAIGLL